MPHANGAIVNGTRVIALVGIFAPHVFPLMAAPMGVMAGWMAALSALRFWLGRKEKMRLPEQENPAQLKTAIFFGVLYSLVKLASLLDGIAARRGIDHE